MIARLTRPYLLAIATAAAGLTAEQGALVLSISLEAYKSRLRDAGRFYRRSGYIIRNTVELVRAAERDGDIQAPQRIAA